MPKVNLKFIKSKESALKYDAEFNLGKKFNFLDFSIDQCIEYTNTITTNYSSNSKQSHSGADRIDYTTLNLDSFCKEVH